MFSCNDKSLNTLTVSETKRFLKFDSYSRRLRISSRYFNNMSTAFDGEFVDYVGLLYSWTNIGVLLI